MMQHRPRWEKFSDPSEKLIQGMCCQQNVLKLATGLGVSL